MRYLRVALLALFLAANAAQAFAGAPRCNGDPCARMSFQKSGKCFTMHNANSRRVHVHNGIYFYELQPNETAVMKIDVPPGCIVDFGYGTAVTVEFA